MFYTTLAAIKTSNQEQKIETVYIFQKDVEQFFFVYTGMQ